jgi:hypothetical protein
MIVKNANDKKFFVHILFKGDRYGRNDCLTHDKSEPLVEFYDYDYANRNGFGPRGQFVSRYYASDLVTGDLHRPLLLHGGEPSWEVDGASMFKVRETLRNLT